MRQILLRIAVGFVGCLLLSAQQPPPQAPPAGRAGRGAGGRGRSSDGFSQFIRPLASQDVLLRGKSLYAANCTACHASDMRGVAGKGNNLLRSAIAMDDLHGELIGGSLAKHTPPVNLAGDDVVAASEYIHSILATMGSQGSPPGRIPVGLNLNVLVGDPQAGKAYFDGHCAACHSVTGDLKGIGGKYADDPRGLQNAWVAGGGGAGRFGRGGAQATVTMPNGEKIIGRVVREDDFLVIQILANGTRRAIPIENGVPKVEVNDPQMAHKKMVIELDDPRDNNMHNVTAYLATLK
jgi:cytochrome c oxidase cbb3-type subunit III